MFVVCVHATISFGLPGSNVFKEADKCGHREMLRCVKQLEGEGVVRERVPPERHCLDVFS